MIIALPLHLHAPAAIAAMKAGLHVLTEKLMGHSVHECKEMARVAERDRACTWPPATSATTTSSTTTPSKLIDAGLLGDLHYIRAQWHRGNLPGNDSWQQPMPKSVKPKDEQADEARRASWPSWQKKLDELKRSSTSEAKKPNGRRRSSSGRSQGRPEEGPDRRRGRSPRRSRTSATRTRRSRTPTARSSTTARPSRS